MDKQKVETGQLTLAITGMTCQGCANTVQKVLSRVSGTDHAVVDLGTARAIVQGTARPEALVAAVQAAGFGAQLSSST
ncbi:heavy metal-associated domain-containing protein [Hyphomicrobium sp.]|uniref:heavy-metal-associated domain-containing protein n=1 Tax=Hyphomicrobium sp. TaxID=82 RepID=UPI000F9A2797|nr:heavy metal-associated domain-containing protein [Hyphomicrobium sp.]RUO99831.1 MAG: heavy-metal-associated domain-containing protein [Hyphomicrobium sp.]